MDVKTPAQLEQESSNRDSLELVEDYIALMKTKDHKLQEQERIIEIHNNECGSLKEATIELKRELNRLKSESASASDKVEQVESKLQEPDIQSVHAEQAMVNSTNKDVDNVIATQKSEVSFAENQMEIVAELTEELTFSRGRIEGLEAALHQVEKVKMEITKDISSRTKLTNELVVQLASERERLHKQINLVTRDKKAMQSSLQKIRQNNPCIGDVYQKPSESATYLDITSRNKSLRDLLDLLENDRYKDSSQHNYEKCFLLSLFILLIVLIVSFVFGIG